MSKKKQIIIFSLVIFFLLFFSLIITSGPAKKTEQSNPAAPADKKVLLSDEDYRVAVKKIFQSYESSFGNNSLTAEKISEYKNQLLGLKGFEAKYKNLHLNFILAMDKMASHLTSGQQLEKVASQQIISQLKIDYGWLSN